MLDSFRNFTKSLAGKIIVFVILGIIAVAFAAGDITGLGRGGPKASVVATVGDREITDVQLRERVERFLRARRSEGQPITIQEFLARGGLEMALGELIDTAAIEEFAQRSGMNVTEGMIDSNIANDPAFHGLDGKFSQEKYEGLLPQGDYTPASYRNYLRSDFYIGWILRGPVPNIAPPDALLRPYASLTLQRRTGMITMIRAEDMARGPDPDDAALNAYYTRNKLRYQIPPRRVLRYAIVKGDFFRATAAATEAEISAAFAQAGARYAATEKRTVNQVVLPDQATANAVLAEVKAGKSIADAASARGLQPSTFSAIERAELVRQTSQPVADAAFGAATAGVIGPVRSPLGWVVMRVDAITKVPARTLAQVHDELASEITARKTAEALVNLRQTLEDNIGRGGTFDQAMTAGKLTPMTTAALIANGTNPEVANSQPDAAIAPIVTAGFQADPDSQEPLIVPIDQEGSFAVVTVDRAIAPTPRPLTAIRASVLADYHHEEGLKKAREAAKKLVELLNKGVPLQQALAQLGVRARTPEAFDHVRGDLKPDDPAQLRMTFSMAAKSGKMVESADRSGYYVVYVATIEDHDAAGNAAALEKARTTFFPQIRLEQAEEFVESIRRNVVVKRNDAAIAAVRASLSGQGAR